MENIIELIKALPTTTIHEATKDIAHMHSEARIRAAGQTKRGRDSQECEGPKLKKKSLK